MKESPWLILDVDYLCHRAEHSTGGLKFKGRMTGVLYGFFKALITLQNRFDTHRVIFCFDSKISVRKKLYPEYKANRHQTPLTKEQAIAAVEYHHQIIKLREDYLPSVGFRNILHQPGYESDDMIAAAVLRFRTQPWHQAVIVSADKDLYQCITPQVQMFNPQTEVLTTWESFSKKYKVYPPVWPIVKAVGGCSSDNIPGAPGVGEITALKLIRSELKEGCKALKSVWTFTDSPDYRRNQKLVLLPYPGTKTIGMERDAISKTAWLQLCKKLGFTSLRMECPRGAQ